MQPNKLLFIILTLAFCIFANAAYSQDTAYRDQLIQNASELKLHEDPQWISLLHYKINFWSNGYKGMSFPDSFFFIANDGRTNPASELKETISKFFESSPRKISDDIQPYQCAYIARYSWLKTKLNFDPKRLPESDCKSFKEWYQALNPSGLTLIFPSTYINNPASAFGHTLLRIDQPDQNERTRLLAYTAHYAAATGGENALLYALMGIFGGYPGYFSIAPYYQKVKLYSDLEKRDIWEYALNLNSEEINLMLMHIWELRGIPFSYFYFDENCAYHLLSLLDVARPSLDLMKNSGTWVLPIDSVRALSEKDGLIKNAVFRPSALNKINQRLKHVPRSERILAKKLSKPGASILNPEFSELSEDKKSEVLDLAYEYVNYKILTGSKEMQSQAYNLLKERSSLPQGKSTIVPAPVIRPDQSHDTARAGIGIGTQDGNSFYDLRYRGVYHDLMDPKEGFSYGAQIEIFDAVLRHQREDNIRLHKTDLVDIISLSPRNDLIKPLSWDIKFGFDTTATRDGQDHLIFQLEGGAGFSWQLTERVFAYSLLNISNKAAADYRDDYAIGAKPILGIYIDPIDSWRINLNAAYANYFLGDNHNQNIFGLEQRITLSKNKAIRLEYVYDKSFSEHSNEFSLSFDFYL